jgi:hypothetical protein
MSVHFNLPVHLESFDVEAHTVAPINGVSYSDVFFSYFRCISCVLYFKF